MELVDTLVLGTSAARRVGSSPIIPTRNTYVCLLHLTHYLYTCSMSVLSTQPYKGTRDFYPEDKRIQKWMFSEMRKVLELHGYEEYDASVIEPYELFASKTSEEIINDQIYDFEDRGGRRVVLRPEMTPSVSRMVAARRNELTYPLRWYSLPNLWRYERPQKGRLREHWQLNVDLFGASGLMADTEIVIIADALMQNFGATRDTYVIKYNSRKLIQDILQDYFKLDENQLRSVIRLTDRIHKIETSHFKEQLMHLVPSGIVDELITLIRSRDLLDVPENIGNESLKHLKDIDDYLRSRGLTNIQFDMTLMRGFDYYTDFVFEIFDTNPSNNRSMFGGGRYDNLLSLFGAEPLPTVGFGFGDVTLRIFLEENDLIPSLGSDVDVYAILLSQEPQAQLIIDELRSNDVNVAVDFTGRKLDKCIKTAEKKQIEYVLFIGEDELKTQKYTIKNLKTGDQKAASIKEIASIITNR